MALNPLFHAARIGMHFDADWRNAAGARPVAVGSPAIATPGRFGGGCLDPRSGRLQFAPDPDLNFGTGPFTLEAWVNLSQINDAYLVSRCSEAYGQGNEFFWALNGPNSMYFYWGERGWSSNPLYFQPRSPIPSNEWVHVACTRDSQGMLRMFSDGQKSPTIATVTANLSGNLMTMIGGQPWGGSPNGLMDEVWVYSGVCKWTDDFTPPQEPYDDSLLLPVSIGPKQIKFDMQDGGQGYLANFVESQGSPNVRVARRVRLVESRSGRLVRQTWSGVDGAYRFDGLLRDVEFTVVADDYVGTYPPVACDKLRAT